MIPLRYKDRKKYNKSTSCESPLKRHSSHLVIDHCHKHGWIRGTLCGKCNKWAGGLEYAGPPGFPSIKEERDFKEWLRIRCHECEAGVPTYAFPGRQMRRKITQTRVWDLEDGVSVHKVISTNTYVYYS